MEFGAVLEATITRLYDLLLDVEGALYSYERLGLHFHRIKTCDYCNTPRQ